jgi:Putative metal-binding motif/FG-GAP repeat
LFLSFGLLINPAYKADKADDTGPGPADGGIDDGGSSDGGGTDSVDADGDGFDSDADCDDNNYTAYPGAPERCDGVDQDCDDFVDEDFDLDLDGSLDGEECPELGDDCDDADATVYGGAAEVPYDDIDQDGDAAADFLVSAPSPTFTEDDEGRVLASSGAGGIWLVSGALFTGELASIDDAALMIWTDSLEEHYTGSSLHVGDIDGDGLADFVFGSKNYGYTRKATDETPGRAVVYLGSGL